jgi:hypothetical protein
MLVFLVCEAGSLGQTDASELLGRKLTVHVSDATLIYVLATLAVDHRIPVGLEKSSAHKDEKKVNIDVEGATLREVLDSIARQEPAYRWEVIDGVINFTPAHDRHGFVMTLLDTPVSRFAPAKGIDKFQLRNTVLELPEVQSLMASNEIRIDRFSDYVDRRSIYADDEVDLSISKTNVRSVLNKVIRDSEHKMWVIELTGKNKENLLISF